MSHIDPSSASVADTRSTVTSADAARRAQPEPSIVGCCGGPAPAGVDACCVRDAEVKASGGVGCGCRAPMDDQMARR